MSKYISHTHTHTHACIKRGGGTVRFLTCHAIGENDVDARSTFHGDILHTLDGKDVDEESGANVRSSVVTDLEGPEDSFARMLHLAARVVVLQQGQQVVPLSPKDTAGF